MDLLLHIVKVSNHSKEAILRAKEMCDVFQDTMRDGCINGIAEIFDGETPITGRDVIVKLGVLLKF